MAAPPSDPGLVQQSSLPMVTLLRPGKSTTKLQGIYLATAQPFLSAQSLEGPNMAKEGGRDRTRIPNGQSPGWTAGSFYSLPGAAPEQAQQELQ